MHTIRFGRTEESVSTIALGTWGHSGPQRVGRRAVGWSGHDDTEARAAIVAAHGVGINHFDTADVYGNGRAEKLLGGVWDQVPREQIFLASKVGWDNGPHSHPYHPKFIRERAERSLSYLGTDRIDLYYLHHCNFGPGDRYLDGAVEALQRLKDEGKIRFIGLSDWDCETLREKAEVIDPDVVQPYRNVFNDAYISSGLKDWVQERDAGVAFFSPLKHGLLLGKYQAPTRFPEGDMRNHVPEFQNSEVLTRLQQNADQAVERFASRPQPVLHALAGYLLNDNPTGSVLLGLRNAQQAEAAGALGEPLEDADAEWLRDLYRSLAGAS